MTDNNNDAALHELCGKLDELLEGECRGNVIVATSLALQRCFGPYKGISPEQLLKVFDGAVAEMRAAIARAHGNTT